MTGAVAEVVMMRVLVSEPRKFTAVRTTLVVATVVGVPLITAPDKLKPAGKGEAENVMGGLPSAVMV